MKTGVGKKISLILLVGGFSESPFVQQEIKSALGSVGVKVMVPHQAGLAVLNGAVIYGRAPETITTRVLRYTYGVKVEKDFREGVDPENLRNPHNRKKCINRFSPFIKEGESVKRGHLVPQVYTTTSPFQPEMSVRIYTAKGSVPDYVTDSMKPLGTLRVPVPNPSDKTRKLGVIFRFGSTSLGIIAIEEDSRKKIVSRFDLGE